MFLPKNTINTFIIVIIIIIIKTLMTNSSISFNNSAYIWQIETIVKNSDNIERTAIYLFCDVLFPTLRLRS